MSCSSSNPYQRPSFAIPELLSLTFSYATHATLAAAARVCRAWSELALDELWRELEWPGYAFELLAPFDSDDMARGGRTHVCFYLQVLALLIAEKFTIASYSGSLDPS